MKGESGSGLTRMPWEQPYLNAVIDQLRPRGEVLEVGFALGYAARRIQEHRPSHHCIIEGSPVVAAEAMRWAKDAPDISIIQDRWEQALPKLGMFDTIFFDDFNPELTVAQTSVVQKGRELIRTVHEMLPQLMHRGYSDADLEDFFGQVGPFDAHRMVRFLRELKERHQISEEQYAKMMRAHRLEEGPAAPTGAADATLTFLETCLKGHMRKGCRFSCFVGRPLSKYEQPEFFASIITNPDLDYQEQWIPVDVPASCAYYKCKEALILTVEMLR